MATTNLGRVGLMLRGNWDNTVNYSALDVVTYNGNSYAAKIANRNVVPTNPTYWQQLASNAGAVLYNADMGLLPAQKEQARENIGAASEEYVQNYFSTNVEHSVEAMQEAMNIIMAYCRLVHVSVEGNTLNIDTAYITSDNAYNMAVLNGYTGTEEEWDAYITSLGENTWKDQVEAEVSDAVETANTAIESVNGKVTAKHASITILTTDWSGSEAPYTASKTCDIVKSTDEILIGIGESATATAQEAAAKANLMCISQLTGTLVIQANGTKPTVDIPVNVIALEG